MQSSNLFFFNRFVYYIKHAASFISSNLFAIGILGQLWHTHRKIITPAFHFNILEKFIDVFNEKGRTLIKLLNQETKKGSFDIYQHINLYAFDNILGIINMRLKKTFV